MTLRDALLPKSDYDPNQESSPVYEIYRSLWPPTVYIRLKRLDLYTNLDLGNLGTYFSTVFIKGILTERPLIVSPWHPTVQDLAADDWRHITPSERIGGTDG